MADSSNWTYIFANITKSSYQSRFEVPPLYPLWLVVSLVHDMVPSMFTHIGCFKSFMWSVQSCVKSSLTTTFSMPPVLLSLMARKKISPIRGTFLRFCPLSMEDYVTSVSRFICSFWTISTRHHHPLHCQRQLHTPPL